MIRRSAALISSGLLLALVLGPLTVLVSAVSGVTSMAGSFYGITDGPGTGALVVLCLGGLLVLAGWIIAIIGFHRLAGTVDALGRHHFGP
ncbi:MAG: hypothetical protein ACTHWW_12615 [Arthrobacter sp.]|uniref:hypothetical protein n=1 Tax=unclassified Arthrobacter TaxID=235627 RepID=UPI002654D3BD|nr:hypothetical protein [Micrococcaceae bacterium]MDN5813664.1 hypothetical protein [Micrococcaceae bacterium]MDN5824559.1 hypothetical protein [Micrococcaceae bacterium]MDN5906295.1 hypothetical protein [Micrococcaceae bacterium]MDN6169701.1 hypothetical protein [Micrococcaceae bacterium]